MTFDFKLYVVSDEVECFNVKFAYLLNNYVGEKFEFIVIINQDITHIYITFSKSDGFY